MPTIIRFTHKGDFSKTTNFLKRAKKAVRYSDLEKYAKKGVEALVSATPVETGLTASSWTYEIVSEGGSIVINFINTNVNKGVPIAIILQYGHATGNGGWVEGRDYINPTIQPIFDEMVKDLWREVTKL
jgi:hypothetical protein